MMQRVTKRVWLGLVAVLLLGVLACTCVYLFTPWPKALLIRYAFDKGAAQASAQLQKHVPVNIRTIASQQYRAGDNDAWLDIYYPSDARYSGQKLPVIVWTHGGAWISGQRQDVANYVKILASHGYAAVTIDYSIAPEAQYPTPLIQLNAALAYLHANAQRLQLDTRRIVLAGDSAGAQITAQMATIISNPAYAQQLAIQPAIQPAQLKGVLLNCGVYDTSLVDYDGAFGGFLKTVMWSYSGSKDFLNDPRLKTLSVVNYVDAQFPPAFITVGNADPLKPQSLVLAAKLQQLGVSTDTLFYPDNYQPALAHEYQFNLDDSVGKLALQRMLNFLQQHLNSADKTPVK